MTLLEKAQLDRNNSFDILFGLYFRPMTMLNNGYGIL